MSKLSKIIAALCVLSVTPVVYSGLKDDAKRTEPTKVHTMARIPKKSAKPAGTLTCWQEGRQIFQSNHISRTPSPENATLELATGGKSIKLMDFKNGLCILEQARQKKKTSKK